MLMPFFVALVALQPQGSRPSDVLSRIEASHCSAFVENQGQWDSSIRFAARGQATDIAAGTDFILMSPKASVDSRGATVALVFENTDLSEPPSGESPAAGKVHFLRGDDAERWIRGASRYDRVKWADVYDGIDIVLRRNAFGVPEYDILVDRASNLDDVSIRCVGSTNMFIAGDGSLVIESPVGRLRQPVPTTWVESIDGARQVVSSGFRILGNDRFGFWARRSSELGRTVVDPALEWASLMGGSTPAPPNTVPTERVHCVAVAHNGDVLIAGECRTADFPITTGSYQTSNAGWGDAFVARFTSDGSQLVFSTFLGGSLPDRALDLSLAPSGELTIAGGTFSTDFPTTAGVLEGTKSIVSESVFVACLASDGSSLLYSTYLASNSGGNGVASSVRSASSTGVWIAGSTTSASFPTTGNAVQPADPSPNQTSGFLARLDARGTSLGYSSYLGGNGFTSASSVCPLPDGTVAACGTTDTLGFPTTAGAFMPSHPGSAGFVVRVDPSAPQLVFGTFLGASGSVIPLDLAAGPDESLYVTGWTNAADFPTTPGAFQTSPGGPAEDAFLSRLDSSGSSLVFSSYLGGEAIDRAHRLALDPSGSVTVGGVTSSTTFPTTPGAFQTQKAGPIGSTDNFVARLRPDGGGLVHSTYLGGSQFEEDVGEHAFSVAVGPDGSVGCAGMTRSPDFPVTPGAFDITLADARDVFVAKLDMLPAGVSRFGAPTAGCAGPSYLDVFSAPTVGSAAFALRAVNGPPNGLALFVVGATALSAPVDAAGVGLWIDPTAIAVLPAVTDPAGTLLVPAPIPVGAAVGQTGHVQCLFADLCGPAGVSATHALAVTIQP